MGAWSPSTTQKPRSESRITQGREQDSLLGAESEADGELSVRTVVSELPDQRRARPGVRQLFAGDTFRPGKRLPVDC